MTSTIRRANDPPRTASRADSTATVDAPPLPNPSTARTHLPTQDQQAHSHGLLLTLHSTARTHSDLLNSLGSRAFILQSFERWEHLLHACEQLSRGAVLLDLDEAERSSGLRALGISAYRLIELLARDLADRCVALAVVTARDYVEVEDLMRTGVHALLHPHADAEWSAEQVHHASARREPPTPAESAPEPARQDVVIAGAAGPSHQDESPESEGLSPAAAEPIPTAVPLAS